MIRSYCPSCANPAVRAIGNVDSPILIIGEFPGETEMKTGKPFVGGAGDILRRELAYNGIDMINCRVTNLWLHEPNDNENCLQAGIDMIMEEVKGKKIILLVGSDAVSQFTNYKVSDVCGLEVDSETLLCDHIFAMVNPAICFHKGNGEVKLAIKKFANKVKELGLIEEENWNE